MPALCRFAARIYFDRSRLQDVFGILQILRTHSVTLLHVEPRPNPPERANDQGQSLLEKQFDFPQLNNLLLTSPATLCGLESLEIPYVSPEKNHSSVMLITRYVDLPLFDRLLSDEVTEVIEIFSHRPIVVQHLHIQVETLDAPLIYMLASRLPGLFSLVLVYHEPQYVKLPIVSDYTTFIEIEVGQVAKPNSTRDFIV